MDLHALASTRRALHGIAESVLAGPQHRRSGELALRQSPGGFATTAEPDLRVEERVLVVAGTHRIPLVGTLGALAHAADVEFGPAADLYPDHADIDPADEIVLDETSLKMIIDWFALGAAALATFAPDQPARLWPEHFDLAIDLDAVTYGVSPGDEAHPEPYAYISGQTDHPHEFWNASFGSVRSAADLESPELLDAFWREGQRRLESDSSSDLPR